MFILFLMLTSSFIVKADDLFSLRFYCLQEKKFWDKTIPWSALTGWPPINIAPDLEKPIIDNYPKFYWYISESIWPNEFLPGSEGLRKLGAGRLYMHDMQSGESVVTEYLKAVNGLFKNCINVSIHRAADAIDKYLLNERISTLESVIKPINELYKKLVAELTKANPSITEIENLKKRIKALEDFKNSMIDKDA